MGLTRDLRNRGLLDRMISFMASLNNRIHDLGFMRDMYHLHHDEV